jgi:hypothetical protein
MTFPNPLKLAKAALVAAYAKWRGYQIIATKRTMRSRFRLCRICVHNPDGFQCAKCSCLLEAKISLNTERCPAGRWERVWKKAQIR